MGGCGVAGFEKKECAPHRRKGGRTLTWHRVGVIGQKLAYELGDHAVDAKGRSGGDEGREEGHNKEDELEHGAHTPALLSDKSTRA